MIFIERDIPLSYEEIKDKLSILEKACSEGDDNIAREALRAVVPTFKRPEDVNKDVNEKVDVEAICSSLEKELTIV